MKYVRFLGERGPRWGVVEGEQVRTLAYPPYETVSFDGGTIPFAQCRLLAPCEPTKIICVGKNYYEHTLELHEGEAPDHPILFQKGPNTVNHPGGAICAPSFVKRLDYEGELAFVIKRRAKNVKEKDFADYILGYTVLNDVTARDIQEIDGQWTRSKGMDGFAPIGPWVTDEVDPSDLAIMTRLNGKTVQASRTSKLLFSIPVLMAFITAAMTLEPGDVVTTGTPAGIGPMRPGDQVEVEIEQIGILQNEVK